MLPQSQPDLLPVCFLPMVVCCFKPCQVHDKSDEANKYFVVLDVAAHAASHVLDLSTVKPDFVTLSFYKVGAFVSARRQL